MKLKAIPEGRKDIWIPEKESLKEFIKSRGLEDIHNFVQTGPSGGLLLGADHDVESVLNDIDHAVRLAVFTDPNANAAHSLALILDSPPMGEHLEMYDIGEITTGDLG